MEITAQHFPKHDMGLILFYSLEKHTDEVEMTPINGHLRDLARQNDKRPAYMSFYTSDDWVKNVRGWDKTQDVYVAVRIPIEVVQDFYAEYEPKEPEGQEFVAEITQEELSKDPRYFGVATVTIGEKEEVPVA